MEVDCHIRFDLGRASAASSRPRRIAGNPRQGRALVHTRAPGSYSSSRADATIQRAERAMSQIGEGRSFLIVYYGTDYAGGWQSLDAPLRTVTTLDRFGLVTWKNNNPMLRMLQPPELLRAMGAGIVHKLPGGSRRDRIKLCGNGVCSPVMEVIFRKINHITKNGSEITATD